MQFLSTPSARRATRRRESSRATKGDFYPRPPRGGRPISIFGSAMDDIFLSTPSARRATRPQRSPTTRRAISIHALREEGDSPPPWRCLRSWYFYPRPPRGGRPDASLILGRVIAISIHALREEGDVIVCLLEAVVIVFLSTPSARRATKKIPAHTREEKYFYPRPPRGGRQAHQDLGGGVHSISIHALREEGDVQFAVIKSWGKIFLSTPSARRATDKAIHTQYNRRYFYPRPPRGGRLSTKGIPAAAFRFLSTPSARRATGQGVDLTLQGVISIHALREEGDFQQVPLGLLR